MESIFFGEQGLTLTSAAHLCALADQVKADAEALVNGVSFINTTVSVVGQVGEHTIAAGYTDLNEFDKAVDTIAKMNSFISWFAEARKALLAYQGEVLDVEIDEWMEERGITLPEQPSYTPIRQSSLEDIIAQMSISDRQLYLALEAKASVLGKIIHPSKPFERARAEVHKHSKAPYSNEGSGRDTLIYHYTPSIHVNVVDDHFMRLQKEYRQTEQQLNHMKAELRKKLEEVNLKESNANLARIDEYNAAKDAWYSEKKVISEKFSSWKVEEQSKLAKLKLTVPHALQETVNFLNSL